MLSHSEPQKTVPHSVNSSQGLSCGHLMPLKDMQSGPPDCVPFRRPPQLTAAVGPLDSHWDELPAAPEARSRSP